MNRLACAATVLLVACSGGGASRAASDATPPAAATGVTAERVFEIRTYTALPGRLDALNARFRNHTMRIFEKHGMTNIGYWIPQDSARKDNTLIYIIAHASRAQADRNWEAFGNDPEWQRVETESQQDGKIIDRIESVYVTPTDYSPIK